jgi:light-regulated signal transduction histidine kinase (bacteriophytochrome)
MTTHTVSQLLTAALCLMTGLVGVAGLWLRRIAAQRDRAASQAMQSDLALRQCEGRRAAELTDSGVELELVTFSLGHDLRVPLGAIDGFAEILLRRIDSDAASDVAGYLKRIRANAAQMKLLVESLLEYSRLARRSPEPQRVDTRTMVLACLETVRSDHGERDVQISLGDLPDCVADPMLVRQVWMKLIDNAFKFTSRCSSPRIEIGGSSTDAGVTYFVSDNGIGFDMNEADQLFKLLHRLERASEFSGYGTGLALVRRIILRHGGHVRAEAEAGAGATIHFALPDPRP